MMPRSSSLIRGLVLACVVPHLHGCAVLIQQHNSVFGADRMPPEQTTTWAVALVAVVSIICVSVLTAVIYVARLGHRQNATGSPAVTNEASANCPDLKTPAPVTVAEESRYSPVTAGTTTEV
jgi:hypothetical protein